MPAARRCYWRWNRLSRSVTASEPDAAARTPWHVAGKRQVRMAAASPVRRPQVADVVRPGSISPQIRVGIGSITAGIPASDRIRPSTSATNCPLTVGPVRIHRRAAPDHPVVNVIAVPDLEPTRAPPIDPTAKIAVGGEVLDGSGRSVCHTSGHSRAQYDPVGGRQTRARSVPAAASAPQYVREHRPRANEPPAVAGGPLNEQPLAKALTCALARAVAWNRLHGPDTRMSGGSKNLVSPGRSAGPRSANDVDDDSTPVLG